MARKSLLEMTQDILSAMSSDNVNSISDTEESTMVAQHIRDTYDYLITSREWPFLKKLTTLIPSGDFDKPTLFTIPTNLDQIYWMKYDNAYVTYKEPSEFHDMIKGRDITLTTVDSDGWINDRDPTYFTSYDDQEVYFDSYDNTEGSTLLVDKLVVYGLEIPTWTHTDAFFPDLPEKFYTLLYQESLSVCFLDVKQSGNVKAESNARNTKSRMHSNSQRFSTKKHNTFQNNFGRKP